MNNENVSFASLKLLYYRYKDTVYYSIFTIGFLVIVALVLLVQVVVPQVSQWFSVQREVDSLEQKIQTIRENTSFLSSQNQQVLEEDVEATTEALPFEKDYSGIISALTAAASRTGIPLPDFSLSVGDVSETLPQSESAKVAMTLSLLTNVQGAKLFIDELSKTLPLSSVSHLSFAQNVTSVTVEFYYRGFPQLTIDQTQKLTLLSPEERDLLLRLKQWRVPVQGGSLPAEEASGSGGFFEPL